MTRPHVTIYNEVSVDGRIEGFATDAGRYYRLGFRWRSDAILMGSVTASSFGPNESAAEQAMAGPAPEPGPVVPGFENLVYEPRPVLVVPDSRGVVRNWRHAQAQPWYGGMVALASERTPVAYLDYLRRRGVDHIVTGEDRVDLGAALTELGDRFGVRTIRTDCGGALNGALLAAGLVDEIALLVSPRVSADPLARSLVRLPQELPSGPVALHLLEAETLSDGAVWLRYLLTARP